MPPSAAFTFVRIAHEFARWRGVPDAKRSEMPAWWWAPALALRDDSTPLSGDIAARFGLSAHATHADAARLILASIGAQEHQPWPENFPEKYSAKTEDPAASAEPAAQAASAAVVPIA